MPESPAGQRALKRHVQQQQITHQGQTNNQASTSSDGASSSRRYPLAGQGLPLGAAPLPTHEQQYQQHSHRRDISSSSAADIGLRGMHSRQVSSAMASPLFIQTVTGRDATAAAAVGNAPASSFHAYAATDSGAERRGSVGAWSQISLGQYYEDETDLGGQFDDPPRRAAEDNDHEDDDRAHLTPRRPGRPSSRRNPPSQARLYDSPVPPDLDPEDDYAEGRKPRRAMNDVESSPEVPQHSHAFRSTTARRSVRARGTEQYYRSGGGLDGAGVIRRRTLAESAKRELKRMSLRVVNLKQKDETVHVRLDDEDEDGHERQRERAEPAVAHPPGAVGQATRDDTDASSGSAADLHLGPTETGATAEPEEEDLTHWGLGDGVLRGRTLGMFGPDSRLRKAALAIFTWPWTEPAILLLIVANIVILTIQSSPNVFDHPRPTRRGYFHSWEDIVLFAIFVCFTVEIMARILVSGLLFNPEEIPRADTFRERCKLVWDRLFKSDRALSRGGGVRGSVRRPNVPSGAGSAAPSVHHLRYGTGSTHDSTLSVNELGGKGPTSLYPPSSAKPTIRSFQSTSNLLPGSKAAASFPPGHGLAKSGTLHGDVPFIQAMQAQHHQTVNHHKAFLRHSWNRVDFVAVLSFWIMFLLALLGIASRESILVFRALSTLRGARLLTITSGTSTILRSLKQSAPLMVNVAFFVVFAMALFSIVGVQAFKGSYKRSCVWLSPDGVAEENLVLDQHCGGHINASTGRRSSYIPEGLGFPLSGDGKGFICPLGQVCMEGENPNNGTTSFDNVAASLMQVIILTGINTWTDIMYSMVDAENKVSSLFSIACVIFLNFWLANIFVAVIINTFGNIREETKHSAFAGKSKADMLADAQDSNADSKKNKKPRRSVQMWRKTIQFSNWAWIGAIVADVGIQAAKTADDPPSRIRMFNRLELYFTLAFLVEIVIRFMTSLPDWRAFFKRASNRVDAALVLITTIIQIPVIRDSAVYPWMTAFQLMRFYRVILVVPRMRTLLAKMLSSVAGLINMILFLLLMNFLGAVIAVQFLRGEVPAEVDGDSIQYSFYQIYNAFLAIYIIFSTENWTDILGTTLASMHHQVWIAAIFLCGWFLFANFILLQMFIAVLNEGFEIVEEEKQRAQAEAFARRHEPQTPTVSWVSRWNPYPFFKARSAGTANAMSRPMQESLPLGPATRRDLRDSDGYGFRDRPDQRHDSSAGSYLSSLKRMVRRKAGRDSANLRKSYRGSAELDVDAQLKLLDFAGGNRAVQEKDVESERKAAQMDFIYAHPTYDRALWIFSQRNPLRRLCQRFVEPAYGDRIFGVQPHRSWAAAFKLVILGAIIGSVTVAAVATPVYRREYYLDNHHIRLTWFNLTEASLGFIFIIEFLVKVTADGFIFAPNAYLLSIWNMLDFFILLTIVINVSTALSSDSNAVSAFTRSLKAFRALRLVNLSDTMRQTFYNVLIIGASRIIDAAVLTVLYVIPFSIWGQNLFSGLLYSCNDGDVLGKAQCVGEYVASPLQWEYLAPRVWENPQMWSFDSFRSAFLILFEIISLEGWTSVLASATAITGLDRQPEQDASQYNSIFFLIYNLLGAITVGTLFVAVIIENFTVRSGMALLTTEQRQWSDLKKLIKRQTPAKRPKVRPTGPWRSWCYDRAVHKHGWWSRSMTILYLIHIGILMSQTASQPEWADTARDYIFLGLTLLYGLDIVVRLSGLGWKSFSQNGWNLYDVFVVAGTFWTTIPLLAGSESQVAVQLQKLFLVSIAFKLVQKNTSLNELYKTAVSSLSPILNVFGLWLALFLVWAIMFLEVFSLTKWQENETWMQNYSTFPRAMLMLVLMSTGEGWNNFMHDYTVEPPYCSPSDSYLFTDCGTATGSFLLFISWNVLSMYIFLNMMTGVVVENFSYVFSLHNRVTSVSREEMRIFKKAWAIYDTSRTGYLRRQHFVPFFSRLSGVFNVRLYPAENRVDALRQAASWDLSIKAPSARVVEGLDLEALDDILDSIDYDEVKRRKRIFNRLYQEALLTEEPGRGISFTNMLLMLAHYKLIDPAKSLQLEALQRRKTKMEQVDDLVSLERIRGLLRTMYWRRRFLQHQAEAKRLPLPAIVLEDDGDDGANDNDEHDGTSHTKENADDIDTQGDDENADLARRTDNGLPTPRARPRPNLSVDTRAISKPPASGKHSPASTVGSGGLLSPRTPTPNANAAGAVYGSQPNSPALSVRSARDSEYASRRPSMSDDVHGPRSSGWARVTEDEAAKEDQAIALRGSAQLDDADARNEE